MVSSAFFFHLFAMFKFSLCMLVFGYPFSFVFIFLFICDFLLLKLHFVITRVSDRLPVVPFHPNRSSSGHLLKEEIF